MSNQKSLRVCDACGAVWQQGQTCEEAFHQCLAWEFDEPQTRFEVHHFLVLCYHLQHPHLYSEEGLTEARKLLDRFISGVSTAEVRRANNKLVDQSNRNWKITANKDSMGAHDENIHWNMTIFDVLQKGPAEYINSVKTWADSIHKTLHSR